MPRQSYPVGEAARLLGVSVDTLRRWDRQGRIKTHRDPANRRRVPATEVERLRRRAAPRELSARNRLSGTVQSVEVDGLLAQVELVAGPFRVLAVITREAAEELGLQLEQGAKADVYASASPKYPDRLYREKLVERPRVFARNSLVLIVPRGNPGRVTGLGSLMRPPVKLVLGADGVPVGDYTRKLLDRYCRSIFQPRARCPAARVVSEEQDVKGVVAKVALGEADAGFV